MKSLFDKVSIMCSEYTTRTYSTSFSLGIRFLDKEFRSPIYSIYGFVRFADEIVDTFDDYDKPYLFEKFCTDTYEAIDQKISLNPILNSFQEVVHKYNIEIELIDSFFKSMKMDLDKKQYDLKGYEEYILGSAEVVGLMCLRVFVKGNDPLYFKLKPYSMKLGAAFQKINFLRDIKADYEILGRTYFPEVNLESFTKEQKNKIEIEIEEDFKEALIGIKALPQESKSGVYLAYFYYKCLLEKIKKLPADRILKERIRLPNNEKFLLMLNSMVRIKLNTL